LNSFLAKRKSSSVTSGEYIFSPHLLQTSAGTLFYRLHACFVFYVGEKS
jgi:hypothetical protein